VEAEELEIARLLLDCGYQLNDVPYRSSWYKFGGTAIKMAAEQGASDIVQLCLDRGADPDIAGAFSLLTEMQPLSGLPRGFDFSPPIPIPCLSPHGDI